MSKILYKKQLSENVFLIRLEAPLIAEERKAGQFIILQIDEEYGERIPLTIAENFQFPLKQYDLSLRNQF